MRSAPLPPTFARRSKSHAFAPCASALSSIAFTASVILYVPVTANSCQVRYAIPPGSILPVSPA